MGEMKSAFERAWERAEKLGELTKEEMEREREKELLPIGKSLSDSFLSHGDIRVIEDTLDKYEDKDRRIIRRGFILSLLDEIKPESEKSRKAMEGILLLMEDKKEEIEELEKILLDFEEEKGRLFKKLRDEIEAEGRDILHQLRISGSAISKFNINRSSVWREALLSLHQDYEARMEGIKGRIREGI